MKPKIGLITTMSPDSTWPDRIVHKVRQDHQKAKLALESIGMEVITASNGISRTNQEMTRHGKILRAKEVEALVIYVGTWTYSNIAVNLARIVGVPVIVWTYSGPGNVGLVGGAITRGALDEVGIPNTLIHGDFGDEKTLKKVYTRCVGCAAAVKLRGTTLGVGGSRCMGMYTAHVDPSEIQKKFGIDIDGWDQGALIEISKGIPDEKAYEFYDWMKEEFGQVSVKKEVMIAQIKMYFALQNLVKEQGYDFLCVKCLPDLPSYYTTFCLAHAFLNDRSDAHGEKESIVCGCEADVNGSITMQMLKNICGGPTMFTDCLVYEEKENIVTLCNCGSQPTDFAPSRKEVYWVAEGLVEFNWTMGGACPQYVAKPGEVTMARLGRIDGEYVMLVVTGQAVTYPREKLMEMNSQQPQAFVRLNCKPDDFIDELRSNHIHLVYGDYVKELEVLCEVLNIRPIILKQGRE